MLTNSQLDLFFQEGTFYRNESVLLLSYTAGLRKAGGKHVVPKPRVARTTDRHQQFRVERSRYASLEDNFRLRIQSMLLAYESGSLDSRAFRGVFSDSLYEYYVRMYLQGKRTAGDVSNSLDSGERRWLHGQHSVQMKFMAGFVSDVESGAGVMPYEQRLDLYGVSGYSVYLAGAILATPDRDLVRWRWTMNVASEHCKECMKRHYQSRHGEGYTTDELLAMGLPGSGKTPCFNKCTCSVERMDYPLSLKRTRPTGFSHVLKLRRKNNA